MVRFIWAQVPLQQAVVGYFWSRLEVVPVALAVSLVFLLAVPLYTQVELYMLRVGKVLYLQVVRL